MVGFNLLREMIVLARAHNDAIPAKLLGGVESGVGGPPQIVTRQAMLRKVATPALTVTGRQGFTTGGTEVHGVWPGCERPSPRGARRSTGSGRGAKGLHHVVHGGARGLAALRKAFTTAARRCTGYGHAAKGFTTGPRRCTGMATLRRASPRAPREVHRSGSRCGGLHHRGHGDARGLAHTAKDSASSCQSRLPVFTRPGRKSTDGC